mmetsp:Transcript_7205/g.7444  ORF Transcript_7205/g.7444 Transcript_7205/m.7444 type:complete len:233 (-) Transcript_7205:63-761(-)
MEGEKKTVFHWPPLESDPEIFNNYMYKIGLSKECSFGELWGLDEEMLSLAPQPLYAVIINYVRGENKFVYDESKKLKSSEVPFFMLQCGELDNACGLIAAIHSIGSNLNKLKLEKNSILEKFYEACKDKDPKERATYLENMNDFKEQHTGFAVQGQSKLCEKQEEVPGHFIAFCLLGNKLVELNGIMGAPYLIEENVKENEFLIKTAEEVKKRLSNKNITDQLSMLFLSKEQ